MTTMISDLVAAVKATGTVIANPQATQQDLEAAAQAEQETVTAYLTEQHEAAQAAREAEAGA